LATYPEISLNILVIASQTFYTDRGTPIDVDILVRALAERGERVDLLCYHEGVDRDYPNLTIHRIEPPSWIRDVGPGFSFKKLVCDAYLWSAASQLAEENDYDIVHAGEEAVFIAMWLRRRCGLGYVYDLDSSIAQQMVEKMGFLRPAARLFNTLEGAAIRNAVATAPVCHALADLARARGANHVVTLHDISQLDVDELKPNGQLRGMLGPKLPADRLVLMYVGNLEPYQGIDLLLDGFARAADQVNVDLVIAGGTAAHIHRYRELARQLEVARRVHFIGPWPADKLASLLAEADILTAPRIRGLNTPMKVFPYLHSAKPLLVTDLPTHSQILDGSVAMLAPPTPAGFADAIVALADDGALRARLGEAGRNFVENNHTYAAHRKRVDALYDFVADTIQSQRTSRE
jgi:glycosyltransferase involved in cell wall biosynthesis